MNPVKIITLSAVSLLLASQANAEIPSKPAIAWMPGEYESGKQIHIKWNMWWGNTGANWFLTDNNIKICQETLDRSDNKAQSGQCTYDFSAGFHALQVHLCSADGCSTSSTKTITVNKGAVNISPDVALYSPPSAVKGSDITITAIASDKDGTIIQVMFYANDTFIGNSDNAPHSITYTIPSEGKITFSATAVDNDNATATARTTTEATASD